MSEAVKNWTEWLKQSRFAYMNEIQKEQTLRWLFSVRDKILQRADIKKGDILLDLGTGNGMLAFGAYEILKNNGKVIASDKYKDCLEECKKIAQEIGIAQNFEFLQSDITDIKLPDNSVDVVVMRSVLVHILNKSQAIKECFRVLKPGGRISIFEPIIRSNTKYYELVNPSSITNYDKFKEIEQKFMSDENDSLTNFDEKTLLNDFKNAGFNDINIDLATEKSTYEANSSMIDPWFNTPPSPGGLTLKEKFLRVLPDEEITRYIEELKRELNGKTITVKSFSAYISAKK